VRAFPVAWKINTIKNDQNCVAKRRLQKQKLHPWKTVLFSIPDEGSFCSWENKNDRRAAHATTLARSWEVASQNRKLPGLVTVNVLGLGTTVVIIMCVMFNE
jgi:hypothetical protein